jgi:glycosyltransferase involved in cell wall biosynthesis
VPAPSGVVRHVLPAVGVLPRDLGRDSVSGLVGAALGFAEAGAGSAERVEVWGLANTAGAGGHYALGGLYLRSLRPWRLGRVGPVDLRYQLAVGRAAVSGAPASLLHVHALPTLLLLRARRRVLHLHMALGRPTALEGRILLRADAVICASAFLAAGFRQQHPHYRGLVRVIRNGASPARYADPAPGSTLRRRLHLRPEEPVIAFAGQVAKEKGIDHLLHALALLPPSERPHLLIAGTSTLWRSIDSAKRPAISPFERELRLASAGLPVSWLGNVAVDAMPGVLLAADIVCCPSVVQEGLATINVEAAAAGKPVVASDVGGIPEVVHDGVTGVLVPAGDAAALARALRRLLKDPTLCRQMGAAARSNVHTWQQAGAELRDLYGRLLPWPPRRSCPSALA